MYEAKESFYRNMHTKHAHAVQFKRALTEAKRAFWCASGNEGQSLAPLVGMQCPTEQR